MYAADVDCVCRELYAAQVHSPLRFEGAARAAARLMGLLDFTTGIGARRYVRRLGTSKKYARTVADVRLMKTEGDTIATRASPQQRAKRRHRRAVTTQPESWTIR